MKEIRYDGADVSNRDFAMPIEVTTTDVTEDDQPQQVTGGQQADDEPRCAHGNPIEVFCNGCEEDRAEFQQKIFATFRNAGAQEIDLSGPHGLARLDAQGLAELRGIILRVIDDGDTVTSLAPHPWDLYNSFEPVADQQRLDFCDEIQRRVVAVAAPATQAKGERR